MSLCAADHCTGRVYAKATGLCGKHHYRLKMFGRIDPTCSADGCTREPEALGMCPKHYHRSRNGLPIENGRHQHAPLAERFWRFVHPGPPDACWEWQGARRPKGYGHIGTVGKKMDGAHRVSYQLHHGPIPDGMFVLHSCDNPPCVNPAHLRVGTPAENTEEMLSKGRARNGREARA